MTSPRYRTPEAFKAALEDRVRKAAKDKAISIDRQRQLVIFDRLMVRLHLEFAGAIVLKGGLALQARVPTGRGTKDLDALASGDPETLLPKLRAAGQRDLGDQITYEIELDPDHPEITGEGIIYGGRRYRVQASLARKVYGNPFGLDVAIGPILFGDPELITAPDHLGFAGIPPAQYSIFPRETHVAEKLHAYTLPRDRINTRVKDLPDFPLLASTSPLHAADLRTAIDRVFAFRKTHPVPATFPDPPAEWQHDYAALAAENNLFWTDLATVTDVARRFLDHVLLLGVGQWDPAKWSWSMTAQEALDALESLATEAQQNPNSTRRYPHLPRLLASAELALQFVPTTSPGHRRALADHASIRQRIETQRSLNLVGADEGQPLATCPDLLCASCVALEPGESVFVCMVCGHRWDAES